MNKRLLPYSEELAVTPSESVRFATYYRDATGLDYADQRFFSSGSGRFLTADPYMASGGTANPGSWNRYSYVEGDPVNFMDPEGLYKCHPDHCRSVQPQPISIEERGRESGGNPLNDPGGRGGVGGGGGKAEEPFTYTSTVTITRPSEGKREKTDRWARDPINWINPLPPPPPTQDYGDYLKCVGAEWAMTLSEDGDQWLLVNGAPVAMATRGLHNMLRLTPRQYQFALVLVAGLADISKAFEIRIPVLDRYTDHLRRRLAVFVRTAAEIDLTCLKPQDSSFASCLA